MKINALKTVKLVGQVITNLNEEPSDIDTSSLWVLAAIGGLLFLAIWALSQFIQ